jgi:hypothetical protein
MFCAILIFCFFELNLVSMYYLKTSPSVCNDFAVLEWVSLVSGRGSGLRHAGRLGIGTWARGEARDWDLDTLGGWGSGLRHAGRLGIGTWARGEAGDRDLDTRGALGRLGIFSWTRGEPGNRYLDTRVGWGSGLEYAGSDGEAGDRDLYTRGCWGSGLGHAGSDGETGDLAVPNWWYLFPCPQRNVQLLFCPFSAALLPYDLLHTR